MANEIKVSSENAARIRECELKREGETLEDCVNRILGVGITRQNAVDKYAPKAAKAAKATTKKSPKKKTAKKRGGKKSAKKSTAAGQGVAEASNPGAV